MAPGQQGHQNPGDKPKKRPADASLASASSKKPKTGESNNQGGSKPAAPAPKPDPRKARAQAARNGRNQPSRVKDTPVGEKQSNGTGGKSFMDRRAVRAIAAQPSDAALKDGELDVQAFLNARGFEIKALDESMRRTMTSKTSRAFQKVPFVLRRRAAAHNHKRVPKRLHRRAKREMDQDNTPTVNSKTRKPKTVRSRLRAETALRLGKLAERKRRQKLLQKGKDGKLDEVTVQTRLARPKIKRNSLNKPVITARKFRRRQLNKTWLPTHLWHTKRAKMTPPKEPLWRFAIPLTPNQKCYRPTHRAMREKGAMAWDTSYMSTISLCGIERSVAQVLKALGMTAESLWNSSGERWRSGAMHWSGTLARTQNNITKMLGPATILWDPELEDQVAEANIKKRATRRLLIRLHPSTFLETFNEVLRLSKGLTPRPHVEDLRYELGSIEVTGPDATEALLGSIKPYHEDLDKKNPHASKWQSLAGVNPSSLPIGSLLAFTARDPRLQFPPRRIQVPGATDGAKQTSASWQQHLAPSPMALFDRDARFKASRLPSQKSINRRKSKESSGTVLEPTQLDPEIPIILLATRQGDTPGKWTVLIPWKCVLPIWYALMHCPLSSGGNPLFGGLEEVQQGAFEQGLPWFPGDFPATSAGTAWELEQREKRKKAWDKMPKGKRVNYETLDLGAGRKGEIGQGWNNDFETLLNLNLPANDVEKPDVVMTGQDNMANEEPNNQEKDVTHKGQLLDGMTHLSKLSFNAHIASKVASLPPAALVTVKVVFLGRGVPSPCARIYRLPTNKTVDAATQAEVPATNPPLVKSSGVPADLGKQWLAALPEKAKQAHATKPVKHNTSANISLGTRTRLLAQELTAPAQLETETINGHSLCPDAEDLIGFVTAGCFNLKEGNAEAIASLSAEKALAERKRHMNKDDRAARLCIVRNSGQSVGWLAKWELV
ncbi:ribonucleases P/MRP protein subunit POP1-domain-containing protein [Truncatella angustata]|uniref:Ribonucleases P/MRP protein subunit POP1-domain-containing protein n=1 Tax=Truncatella angustata TaxID=152316 RepID=A0A9P8ZUN4_9PEZI|nr:ribonucleases P/MRP protein subunit POP1-domain-containing protein [Truncatella angustata]KAH6651884.1 ribonucleases P/MRP protein subunit POP1-domain-containing protein [Truncatella angustata]KAH8205616.1 hypothetical protein TruAng_000110 [Truncatella angustata]